MVEPTLTRCCGTDLTRHAKPPLFPRHPSPSSSSISPVATPCHPLASSTLPSARLPTRRLNSSLRSPPPPPSVSSIRLPARLPDPPPLSARLLYPAATTTARARPHADPLDVIASHWRHQVIRRSDMPEAYRGWCPPPRPSTVSLDCPHLSCRPSTLPAAALFATNPPPLPSASPCPWRPRPFGRPMTS